VVVGAKGHDGGQNAVSRGQLSPEYVAAIEAVAEAAAHLEEARRQAQFAAECG